MNRKPQNESNGSANVTVPENLQGASQSKDHRVTRRRLAVIAVSVVVTLALGCGTVFLVPGLRNSVKHTINSSGVRVSADSTKVAGSKKSDGSFKPVSQPNGGASGGNNASSQKRTGKRGKRHDKQSQAQAKQHVAGGMVTVLPQLTDASRASILEGAKQTVAKSGKPHFDYSYCVASRGAVSDMTVFENTIFRTLNDPRGWPRAGATFSLSTDASHCDMTLYLAQSSQITSFSPGCSNEYSCRVGQSVIINDDRWNGATPQILAAGFNMDRYRIMVINHEVGHRLGHMDNEPFCPAPGKPAPLMQEQSMSLGGCTPNEWPTDAELWISQ